MITNFNPEKYENLLLEIFNEVKSKKKWNQTSLPKILKQFPKDGNFLFRNDELVAGYSYLLTNKKIAKNKKIEERIRLKPTRTSSGVATVTVLTKPYPCPGACIFCPNDPNMPKSYISSEPGAQRALMNKFDPYAQVFNRLLALQNIGHNIEKIELLILGGSWSAYSQNYQRWFIKRCFDAMNDMQKETQVDFLKDFVSESKITVEELKVVQKENETAYCRNVGLVLETRPDLITEEEVIRLRTLGATKIQIGVQSLNDKVVKANKLGRDNKQVANAFRILRTAGFKIHAHWMPNLYKSSVKKDIKDYKKLWTKPYSPDELKVYPTSIVPNTYLNYLYSQNKYRPYTESELMKVLVNTLPYTPRYCRLTRIIRDIPSDEIVDGNKKTNFRQLAEEEIKAKGLKIQDIRAREIRNEKVSMEDFEIEELKYETTISNEYFISCKTKDTDKICGFLRLSLPKYPEDNFINELKNTAIIREIHVYGNVVGISKDSNGESQHLGLGKKLIERSEEISKEKGFNQISVISAIGTREYYRKRGFEMKDLYMIKDI
jgi:elongator complex protein 3